MSYMASLQERKNAKGVITSYRVRWREEGREGPLLHETFKDKQSAETFKRILEINGHDSRKAERDILRAGSSSPTLIAVFEQHITRLTDLTEGSLKEYRRNFANHIEDHLGGMPVSTIDEDDIADWVRYMRDKKLSPRTISNIHGMLFAIMRTAVIRKHRPDNPCEKTRLPKNESTEARTTFLTKAEFALILRHTKKHFHPMFLLLVGTGLRFSEAMALRPGDFSDDHGEYTVQVSRAWKKGQDTRRVLGPPKSNRSRRTVPMSRDLALALAPTIQACDPGEYIFKMEQGGETHSQAVHQKAWKPALEGAKLAGLKKSPRIHDLRHTYASWMLAGGMSIFELSRLMGHESVSTTSNVYSHLMPEAMRKGAEVMGASMEGLFSIKTQAELDAESELKEIEQ